jgi:AcrR family transcriptional regulator
MSAMARTRLHSDDTVLDAATAIVLTEGARAASIGAIAERSGAPVGSLYHRFGSRDGVLRAAWERAVRTFHAAYLPAEVPGPDPIATAAGMAEAVVTFAITDSQAARLLMTLRLEDLLDQPTPAELADLNRELAGAIRSLARASGVSAERVRMAVIDLPYGTVRRHIGTGGRLSRSVRAEVGAGARALLTTDGGATK